MVNTIFANVGTVVCFRSGNPADETMVLPLFSPYVQAGEIANLPTYNFYARLAAVHSQEPLSGETLLLASPSNASIAQKVVRVSREQWGRQSEVREESNPTAVAAKTGTQNDNSSALNIPIKL